MQNENYVEECGRLSTELKLAIWERDLYQLRYEEIFRFLNDYSINALASFYHKHPERLNGLQQSLDRVIDRSEEILEDIRNAK